MQTVRVAAVQVESQNGGGERNLERAVPFVDEAARRGATLILLPEFLATGYVYDTSIWDAAEPSDGATVSWLRERSKRLGVHLGASFLEADGEDFFNTFVLTTPSGDDAGRVRKQTPAGFEAFFTRGDEGPHVIETELGRIGVGICYENQLAYTPRLLSAQRVDLVLMPHSAPSPQRGRPVPARAVDEFEELLRTTPVHYAQALGVPVVFANKCGPWDTPLPGLPGLRQHSSFPGLSAIADSDGTLKAQLGPEPGVVVEDVVLDPARKSPNAPACHGRWARRVPVGARMFQLAEAAGALSYRLSAERRARARAVSSGGTRPNASMG